MRKFRIQVVDDEPPDREAIASTIRKVMDVEGVQAEVVEVAADSHKQVCQYLLVDFVENLRKGDLPAPDLVVLDWVLEGDVHDEFKDVTNGGEVWLRLSEVLAELEVDTSFILATRHQHVDRLGVTWEDIVARGLEHHLFDFWRKPILKEQVQTSLEVFFGLPSRWYQQQWIALLAKEMARASQAFLRAWMDDCQLLEEPKDPGVKHTTARAFQRYEEELILYRQAMGIREHQTTMLKEGPGLCRYVGASESWRRTITLAAQLAASDRNLCILVEGESGTGKELVARMIHDFSYFQEDISGDFSFLPGAGRYFEMSCAAGSKELLLSQLFGHVKGAYTGAYCDKRGLFEIASGTPLRDGGKADEVQGGTVFLDEVGEAPPEFRAMLLRFLETRRVTRLGEEGLGRPVNVRVILATDANLDELRAQGEISEAFLRRVAAARITLDPLRDRREEIPVLTDFFLKSIRERALGRSLESREEDSIGGWLSPGARFELQYGPDWTGNVRQLRHVLESAVTIAAGASVITRAHVREALGLNQHQAMQSAGRQIREAEKELNCKKLDHIEGLLSLACLNHEPGSGPLPRGVVAPVMAKARKDIGFGSNYQRELKKQPGGNTGPLYDLIVEDRERYPYLNDYLRPRGKASI